MRFLAAVENRPQAVCGAGEAGREAGCGAASRILCKHSRGLMFRADYTGYTRAEDKALRRRNLSADSAAGIRRDRAQLVPASSNPGGKA